MVSKHDSKDQDRQLELEKSKYDAAEKGRQALKAELDLIKQQLDLESDTMVRCRRYLEPEERDKLEETKVYSTSAQPLSISEQILLKYKRSNELQTFFE